MKNSEKRERERERNRGKGVRERKREKAGSNDAVAILSTSLPDEINFSAMSSRYSCKWLFWTRAPALPGITELTHERRRSSRRRVVVPEARTATVTHVATDVISGTYRFSIVCNEAPKPAVVFVDILHKDSLQIKSRYSFLENERFSNWHGLDKFWSVKRIRIRELFAREWNWMVEIFCS